MRPDRRFAREPNPRFAAVRRPRAEILAAPAAQALFAQASPPPTRCTGHPRQATRTTAPFSPPCLWNGTLPWLSFPPKAGHNSCRYGARSADNSVSGFSVKGKKCAGRLNNRAIFCCIRSVGWVEVLRRPTISRGGVVGLRSTSTHPTAELPALISPVAYAPGSPIVSSDIGSSPWTDGLSVLCTLDNDRRSLRRDFQGDEDGTHNS